MNIVADENIAYLMIARLQKEGYQVRSIASIAPGSPDSEVLEIAKRNEALLLTEDKDFGELVARYPGRAAGVILLRLKGFSPSERADLLVQVPQEHGEKLLNAFTVISPTVVRIRLYP